MMMKNLISFLLLLLSLPAICQTDSVSQVALNTEITLATRNIWRGLDYGSSPSIQGTLAVTHNYFEIGTYGTTTLNGRKEGYGTWVELYATGKYKNLALTIDDYFFFNAQDSSNNYFDWGKEKTQHFIESRLKWDTDKFDFTAGYAFYKNKADHTHGIYLEAEYAPVANLSFILGGLTSGSYLSFYEKGGITTAGVAGKRSIKVTDSFSLATKASLLFNPNYKHSVNAPGVGTNPVYVVIYLTL